MRLPRMTTRWWMIAVALAALLAGGVVGGYRLNRRRDYFRFRAQRHANFVILIGALKAVSSALPGEAARSRLQTSESEKLELLADPLVFHYEEWIAQLEQRQVWQERRISYNAAMARKYERAARYPWLPVEPDPPEPK